jgi:hypothetical protein
MMVVEVVVVAAAMDVEVMAAALTEVEVALTLVVVDKHEEYRFMLHQLLCKAETYKNLCIPWIFCFLVMTHDVYIWVNLQSNDSLITFSI